MNKVRMNVWFLVPILLFAFIVTSAVLYIYSLWNIYSDPALIVGQAHLKKQQLFLILAVVLHILGSAMAGTVMVLFKKK